MLNADMQKYIVESLSHHYLPRCGFTHARRLNVRGHWNVVEYSVLEDAGGYGAAGDLVNNRYRSRGYGDLHAIPSDAHHATFVAEVDDRVVGTITLAVDSDDGLAIDDTFPEAVGAYREKPGARICELTRLAFDESIRCPEVMAGLFHMAYIYGTSTSDCTDLLIEVNPRHVQFYKRMLGFETIGGLEVNRSVMAPSQLMGVSVAAIRENIRQRAASEGQGRSLYSHFFCEDDERQIRRSLTTEIRQSRLRHMQALQANLAPKVHAEASRAVAEIGGARTDAEVDVAGVTGVAA